MALLALDDTSAESVHLFYANDVDTDVQDAAYSGQ